MSLPDCRARVCAHPIANIAHFIAWSSGSVALTYSTRLCRSARRSVDVSIVMSEKLTVQVDSGYLVKRTRYCVLITIWQSDGYEHTQHAGP
jgi:hypothetical protein